MGQYNLAILYQFGTGVEQNSEQANYWMTKAAQQGFSLAVEALTQEKENEENA